jgi:hypothetical protein
LYMLLCWEFWWGTFGTYKCTPHSAIVSFFSTEYTNPVYFTVRKELDTDNDTCICLDLFICLINKQKIMRLIVVGQFNRVTISQARGV